MNYYEKIQNSINYIEENLYNDICLTDVAKQAEFSIYYFHKMFTFVIEVSLKEYIRKRRLTQAAYSLIYTNNSILNIALDCQYNTHESFSRAFKREFKVNPNEYRKNKKLLNLFGKVDLLKNIKNNTKGEKMIEPKYAKLDNLKIIGVELKTTAENGQNHKQIPEFWEKYFDHKLADKIPNKLNNNKCYGICKDFNETTGIFSYIIGVETSSLTEIPGGFIGFEIPQANYAVFTSKAKNPEEIQETWKFIFTDWLQNSGKEHACKPELEVYDQRMESENPEMDIYIPIK